MKYTSLSAASSTIIPLPCRNAPQPPNTRQQRISLAGSTYTYIGSVRNSYRRAIRLPFVNGTVLNYKISRQ